MGDGLSARDGSHTPGVRVQPTPIYETVAMSIVAWWLWRMRDRFRPGALFAFYLVLSGVERLLVEFVRRNHRIAIGLTAPQLESIALLLAGAIWLLLLRRGGGLRLSAGRAGPRLARGMSRRLILSGSVGGADT